MNFTIQDLLRINIYWKPWFATCFNHHLLLDFILSNVRMSFTKYYLKLYFCKETFQRVIKHIVEATDTHLQKWKQQMIVKVCGSEAHEGFESSLAI